MKLKSAFSLLILSVFLFSINTSLAAAVTSAETERLDKIELIKQQISYLQALLLAMLNQQQPVSSPGYIAVDLSSGNVLAESNSNQPYPIASITKLMNAVVVLENVDLNTTTVLTKEMLAPEGYSPSLFLNLKVSARDLLRAALIQSTNDAAEALSYFVGNEKFLSLMNQKAKDLGMENTQYFDVHGLNLANHSTPADLGKLLKYVYQKHPEMLALTKDNNFWLPDPTGRLLKFQNLNVFYGLPDFVGGKSGYLLQAKQSMASIFRIQGKPVAVVVLSSKDRKADTLSIISSLEVGSVDF